MLVKECPMCGETMRLLHRQVTERIPGMSEARTHDLDEWTCPECDYFEEDGETPEG